VVSTGKVYWEIELLSSKNFGINIGVCRPSCYAVQAEGSLGEGPDAWVFTCCDGKTTNGKLRRPYGTKQWRQGDRVGVLLDYSQGGCCLQFLKNGEAMPGGVSPAYKEGLVPGSLCAVVELMAKEDRVRLIPSPLPEWLGGPSASTGDPAPEGEGGNGGGDPSGDPEPDEDPPAD